MKGSVVLLAAATIAVASLCIGRHCSAVFQVDSVGWKLHGHGDSLDDAGQTGTKYLVRTRAASRVASSSCGSRDWHAST